MNNKFQTLSESQFDAINELNKEFNKGMLALNSLPPNTVTVYGGSRIQADSKAYKNIYEIAKQFAKSGWGVVSGGGPGAMAASMDGAKAGGGQAIAFKIELDNEKVEEIRDVDVIFQHFIPRKYALRQSDVYVYAQGGIGTLDELMENLTLMSTHKMAKKPTFLIGRDFWQGFDTWMQEILLDKWKVVDEDLSQLYTIVDTAEEVVSELGL